MAHSDNPNLSQLEQAAEHVYRTLRPTAQFCWPLLGARCGAEVWVKHENHTPTGAFKVRGGLVYLHKLKSSSPNLPGVILASTGNHGQSIAYAARRAELAATIVVPHGNSPGKNAAMQALGATLIEHGEDFNDALQFAQQRARDLGLHMVPSYHELLMRGVASYSLELLRAVPDLHTVYVPIGLGSGICGMVSARDALGLNATIVGVVADKAPTYKLSFERRQAVPTNSANTFAAGIAVRIPDDEALTIILRGVDRVISLSEEEIADAVRYYFLDTHNLAEGAGAAALAGLYQERERMAGKRVGVVLSGGNIDADVLTNILSDA
ncbi:MAG: threonine dehydratase [Gammaproteobacteria bacterium]|nr:threonine dehydratase [Gammaproteobacteria bacterium]